MVQDWSTSNTYTWTPSSADVGGTLFGVWVRDGKHAGASAADVTANSGYYFQIGAQAGLKGEYYSSSSAGQFTSKVMERIDPTVYFNWGSGSPGSGVPPDRFAVRWTGFLVVSTSGTYKIWAAADDGVRVWIDGKLVIDTWNARPLTVCSWTGTLSAGKHSIKIEYYENIGDAIVKLGWTPPGGSGIYQIPSSNLSPY